MAKSLAKTPAPKKDRIYGSKVNAQGSASSEKSAKSIKLSDEIIVALTKKLKEFKENHTTNKVTLSDLKAVYRRGAGAYSKSHRPTITGGVPNTRNAWAMARVNKFLEKASGNKVKKAYVQDDDLLKMHLGGDMSKHLAPNGKPSNLTHEQWHLVRTPKFKAWFGDWENDPKNASKVVDENGEPLVVYHGTYQKNQFNIFDFGYADLGFHFGTYQQAKERSQTKLYAQGFQSIINPYFLNIRKLINVQDVGEWEYPQRYIDLLVSEGLITEKEANQNGFYKIYNTKDNKLVRDFLNSKFGNIGFEYENIIESNGLSYMVFKPNQIKLADGSNTTFDSNNPDIRYEDGGLLSQQGTLYTRDKKNKLEYYKNGNDYAFKVYDVESNPVQNYTRNQYKKRAENEALMTYNQFINYLYSEQYIDDKYENGGEVDDCINYIKENKSIFDNGYYLDMNKLHETVDPYGQIPKDLDFTLITYNSVGQKDLDVINTINSLGITKEFSKLLNIESNQSYVLAHYFIRKSSRFKDINQLKTKNLVVIDRDRIVCENIQNYKYGGEVDEHKETYKKWKSLVNMSKSELEKFYNSEEGKKAGLTPSQATEHGIDSGRESARWIMKMKDTPVSEWTDNMWRWAKKQISFISRMSGNKGSLYDDKGRKTRKHTSLLIWGHNPEKKNNGGELEFDNPKIGDLVDFGDGLERVTAIQTYSNGKTYIQSVLVDGSSDRRNLYEISEWNDVLSKQDLYKARTDERLENERERNRLNLERQQREQAEKNEYEDVDGFADNLTPMQKAKILQYLNKSFFGKERVKDKLRGIVNTAYIKEYNGKPQIRFDKDDSTYILDNKYQTKASIDYLNYLKSLNKYDNGGEVVLWATKIGEPDWKEEIITNKSEDIDKAKKWASENGYNRFRISKVDMGEKPDFVKAIKKENGGTIDDEQYFIATCNYAGYLPNMRDNDTEKHYKLSEAFDTLFDYMKSEEAKEWMPREGCFFSIEKIFFKGNEQDYKVMYKITGKDAMKLLNKNMLENGGTINQSINTNIMDEIKFNQLPHIDTLKHKDRIILKESVFSGADKPKYIGDRYIDCEIMNHGGMVNTLNLRVIKSVGAKAITPLEVITRPIANVMAKGRKIIVQPIANAVTSFKDGGLNPDNKEVKKYFAHDSGNAGGVLVGKRHSEGGIKAINNSTGQPLEMEGGEVVITRNAVSNPKKYEFQNKEMTTREILSKLNVDGGGVSFAEGGDVPDKMKCGCDKMDFGGSTMTLQDFINRSDAEYQSERLKVGIQKERNDHYDTLSKLNAGTITIEQALREIAQKEMKLDAKYPFAE